jgi:D-arginine dehydrogenase
MCYTWGGAPRSRRTFPPHQECQSSVSSHTFRSLPARVAVIGAGFAGAATAAALARRGFAPGLIVEREALPGSHASGRNAAMIRQVEFDPVIRELTVEGVRRIAQTAYESVPVVRRTGGLYLGDEGTSARLASAVAELAAGGVATEHLQRDEACRRFPFLERFRFASLLSCESDGVADIHALLLALLDDARRAGFELVTHCTVDELLTSGGRVTGLRTTRGEVPAEVVVDASGAWAGRLGRGGAPLPLRPLRRHLFVTSLASGWPHQGPLVWHLDTGFYVRTEGEGLLWSPCDESDHPAAEPVFDVAAQDLLAEKLAAAAPALSDLAVRRGWACLRTFAPDRRPIVGEDPRLGGLFHVSGLGGFGMSASAALGELAAALIAGDAIPAHLRDALTPARFG